MTEQVATTTDSTTTTEAPAAQSVDQLPEWAQTLIKDTRAEAAKYRTERQSFADAAKAETEKAFETKLAEAVSAKDAVEQKLAEAELVSKKTRAAFGVLGTNEETLAKATEVAGLIQGSTDEEIAAHAQKISALFGGANTVTRVPAVDKTPAGGNDAMALNGDPLLDSLKSALGI